MVKWMRFPCRHVGGFLRVSPDKLTPKPIRWIGSVEGHRQHPPLPFSCLQTTLTQSLMTRTLRHSLNGFGIRRNRISATDALALTMV